MVKKKGVWEKKVENHSSRTYSFLNQIENHCNNRMLEYRTCPELWRNRLSYKVKMKVKLQNLPRSVKAFREDPAEVDQI